MTMTTRMTPIDVLDLGDDACFDETGRMVVVVIADEANGRRTSESIVVQSYDDPMTLALDGSGDVYFDYFATENDFKNGREVDMILPGNRWVSFALPAQPFVHVPGIGVRSRARNGEKGDLHVRVVQLHSARRAQLHSDHQFSEKR